MLRMSPRWVDGFQLPIWKEAWMTFRERKSWSVLVALGLIATLAIPASAQEGFITSDPPLVTLNVDGTVTPIISVGEEVDSVKFEGIPDGIGIVDGPTQGTIDVFVTHEQSTVPFQGARDFQDASVTKWTIDSTTNHVVAGELAISSDLGYLRFCSAAIAGPEEGFSTPVFFANEETNDIVDVPDGAPYPPDPAT